MSLYLHRRDDTFLTGRFNFRGQVHKKNLGTADRKEAAKRFNAWRKETQDAIIRGDWAKAKPTNHADTPLSTLYSAYNQCLVDAMPKTRHMNANAMNQILSMANPGTGTAQLTLGMVNGGAVRSWFSAAKQRADAADLAGDQAKSVSLKRSANGRVNQAAGLCAPKALDWYKSQGIPIEGLEDFAKTFKVCRFGRLPDVSYNPPSEEVLQATLAAWEALPDGNVFRTIGMALAFGLRAMEISQAKWSWFNTRNGYPVLDSTGDAVRVKGKTGMVQVRALDPFYTILRAKAQPARGEVTVLNGTPDTVNVNTFIGVSSWLKALGWKTLRHTHALRAYAGSLIAMRYSMYEAQIFLRHSSVVITEGHYSYFVKKFRPANLEDVPARWATTAAPELTILEGGAVVAG